MKIEQGSKLIFIGDSITDCNRSRPVGEGRLDEAYGSGYVNLVRGLLAAQYPDQAIRVMNMGISGNTVRDLKGRWEEDVMAHEPDWVSIMIGINDVWRSFDEYLNPDVSVGIYEYERTLKALVGMTKDKVEGIVLMTPFFLEPRKDDVMRMVTDSYGHVVAKVAKENGCVFVDTQKAMDRIMSYIPSASIAWDRVHPDVKGHMTIALEFVRAVS